MPRWLKFLIFLGFGVALGLLYGWVISPVEYVDVAPGALRADHRLDTVRMVAVIYQSDRDVDAAARRLTLLGSEPPADIAQGALEYAFANNSPNPDLVLIQELVTALQIWQPGGGAP